MPNPRADGCGWGLLLAPTPYAADRRITQAHALGNRDKRFGAVRPADWCEFPGGSEEVNREVPRGSPEPPQAGVHTFAPRPPRTPRCPAPRPGPARAARSPPGHRQGRPPPAPGRGRARAGRPLRQLGHASPYPVPPRLVVGGQRQPVSPAGDHPGCRTAPRPCRTGRRCARASLGRPGTRKDVGGIRSPVRSKAINRRCTRRTTTPSGRRFTATPVPDPCSRDLCAACLPAAPPVRARRPNPRAAPRPERG